MYYLTRNVLDSDFKKVENLARGTMSVREFKVINSFPTSGKSTVVQHIDTLYDIDDFVELLYRWSILNKVTEDRSNDAKQELYVNCILTAQTLILRLLDQQETLMTFNPGTEYAPHQDWLYVIPTTKRYLAGWADRGDEAYKPEADKDWFKIFFDQIADSAFHILVLDEGEHLADAFLPQGAEPTDQEQEEGRADNNLSRSRIFKLLQRKELRMATPKLVERLSTFQDKENRVK